MLMINILIAVAILGGGYFGIRKFNEHCYARFRYRFFTKTSYYIAMAAACSVYFGIAWYLSSQTGPNDTMATEPLNGIVLATVGGLLGIGLIAHNFRRTNFIYGLGGSILQIGIFSALIPAGIALAFIALALLLFSTLGSGESPDLYWHRRR